MKRRLLFQVYSFLKPAVNRNLFQQVSAYIMIISFGSCRGILISVRRHPLYRITIPL